MQVYLTASRTWQVRELQTEQVEEFKAARSEAGVKTVAAHVPFLVNLASCDDALFERSRERLFVEVMRGASLGVSNVVLHPGSCTGQTRAEGLVRVVHALTHVVEKLSTHLVQEPKILLETMAGQGNTLGATFEEIAEVLERVGSTRVGVCLDTAHVFAAGYDIRGRDGWHRVMGEFDAVVGLDHLRVIHLNDSKEPLHSRRDRHANIGEGYLGLETFFAIVTDDRLTDIPKILETPDRDARASEDLKILRSLHSRDGEPDFPAPPLVEDLECQGHLWG